MDSTLISLLPNFKGICIENPFIHLRDFRHVCSAFNPFILYEGNFMVQYFRYSLSGRALSWFCSLTIGPSCSWEGIRQAFLKEFSMKQYLCEPFFRYFERFGYMLHNSPNHGLPEHVLIQSLLDGMLPDERYILDVLAGGSVMDCTPTHVQKLIDDRAYNTRSRLEYNPDPRSAEIIAQIERNERRLIEMAKQIDLYKNGTPDLRSAPTEFLSEPALADEKDIKEDIHYDDGDEESLILVEECANDLDGQNFRVEDFPTFLETTLVNEEEKEDVQDDTLFTELVECIDDRVFSSKDLIPLHCSDMKTTQSTVSICTDSLSLLTDTLLCFSLQGVVIFPLAKTCLDSEISGRLLGLVATNWKKRKKVTHENIQVVRCYKQLSNSQGSSTVKCLNWKRRKKKRHKLDGERVSSHFRMKQQRSCMFGWKPGWNLKERACGVEEKHDGCCSKKFDGVHPWAPNI